MRSARFITSAAAALLVMPLLLAPLPPRAAVALDAPANTLSDAEKEEGWLLLFNGKDLSGFGKPTRDGKWSARDGVLTGTGGKGVIATKAAFDDFLLTFEVRISDTGDRRGNSGVYIRSTGLMKHRGRWPDGMEIQIDHGDPEFWTGSVWHGARARKVDLEDGKWLAMTIQATGPRIRVWINGELVTDHVQPGPIHAGPIAFQVHHATDVVEFRNVKLLPLRRA